MARNTYRQTTVALPLSLPWLRSVAGLWLLAIAALSFVSVDPSFSGPKQWIVDGSMHAGIFLALTLAPGLFARSPSTLVVAALITLGLTVGLETAQAVRNEAPIERADILANLLGFAIGLVLVVLLRRKASRPSAGAGRLAREMRQRFGFTTTESRLASHLASGGSLASYAEFVGQSVGTIRNAAAQIYERTRTKDQSEFMRLVRAEEPRGPKHRRR